jgi:2',3'-cyclic-nucleotide 2'-phosphodiesterase (5'-nucleotidase family)
MRLARASALALIALALNCATASNNASTPVTNTAGQPVPLGQVSRWKGPGIAKKLVIVGINDTHGGLLAQTPSKGLAKMGIGDVGGADWFAGWMTAVRAEAAEKGGDVLILDAGDEFQGTLISNQFRGASVVDAYNAIGVAAGAVGNHEFDFGIPVLKERMAQAKYPILAANVFLKGTNNRPDWAKPTAIINAAGTKVGIIGLSTEETPLTTNPVNIADLDFRSGGPIAAVLADELRAQGCTIVLITAHMGPKGDREIQRVAEAVQGKVDGIVSGHHHEPIGPPPLIVANIPIVQSGAKLVAFSTIELTLNDKGHTTSYAVNDGNWPKPGGPQAMIHSLDGSPAKYRGHEVVPDPGVATLLKGYDDQVSKMREEIIGSTEVTMTKGGDNLLANLCADSLRSGAAGSLKADFAFQNGGGIRVSEIPAGPIKFGQVFDLYPFDNEQVVITLPMPAVRDALEAILHAGKSPMRVSGMRYTVDWEKFGANKNLKAAPPGAIVTEVLDEDGKPLCITKSCTADSCTSTCRAGTVTLSVTDFLANGGDGLTLLKNPAFPHQVGPIGSRDSIVGYVKEHSPLTAKQLGSTAGGAPDRVTVKGSSGTD